MKTKANDPISWRLSQPSQTGTKGVESCHLGGLTKRELFAAMAMQGLCVPCTPGRHNTNDAGESAFKAEMAVRLADALIKALNEVKNESE